MRLLSTSRASKPSTPGSPRPPTHACARRGSGQPKGSAQSAPQGTAEPGEPQRIANGLPAAGVDVAPLGRVMMDDQVGNVAQRPAARSQVGRQPFLLATNQLAPR